MIIDQPTYVLLSMELYQKVAGQNGGRRLLGWPRPPDAAVPTYGRRTFETTPSAA